MTTRMKVSAALRDRIGVGLSRGELDIEKAAAKLGRASRTLRTWSAWSGRNGAALTPEEQRFIDELTRASAAPSSKSQNLAELLLAVGREPGSDAPCRVLADAYHERADPRGELIALQLRRLETGEPPTALETKLLPKAMKLWCAELGNVVVGESVQLRRGLPSRATLKHVRKIDSLGAPVWAVVEELDSENPPLRLLTTCPLLSLRTLELYGDSLEQLSEAEGLTFPSLRRLVCSEPLPESVAAAKACFTALECLELRLHDAREAGAFLSADCPGEVHLALGGSRWRIDFTKATIDVSTGGPDEFYVEELEQALAGISLSGFAVTITAYQAIPAQQRQRVQRATSLPLTWRQGQMSW